jgi:two-component system sensor histidine kinase HydH
MSFPVEQICVEEYTQMVMLKGRIRNATKRGLLFHVLLGCIFLLIAFLLVVIFSGERERNRLLSQYEAERTLFDIGEALRRGAALEEVLGENVRGFGIYDPQGIPLQRWGTAPGSYLYDEKNNRFFHFVFNKDEKTLVLLRGFPKPPKEKIRPQEEEPRSSVGMPEPADDERNDPSVKPRERARSIFLEISTTKYYRKEMFLTAIMIGLLGLLAGTLLFIMRIYRRYREYRDKIEAQKQLVHLGEAARTLSHEIKNPLSAIRLRTGILKKTTTEETTEDLKIIEEEIDRLGLLTEKVSDFLKNPHGEPETIALNSFLKDLLTRFGPRVVFDPSTAEECFVEMDRERLRSVVENLLNNALESDADKGEVRIQLALSKHWVTISILDRGTGISPETRKHVFDPFFTTKTRGSGIGLSISKRFVEAAGGFIGLSPGQTGGTEAKIVLRRGKG